MNIFVLTGGHLEPILNLKSLKEKAREQLPKMAFDFIAGGADDEWTLHANEQAWEEIHLLPKRLHGAEKRKLKTTVLGTSIDFPVLVAPMGFQCLAHPEGEVASAQGAHEAGTIFCLSTTSTRSIEEVARASSGPKWFQLYVYKDRSITLDLIKRAASAGFKAICLTVDAPIEGRRERDKTNEFHLPPGLTIANFKNDPKLKNMRGSEKESAITNYIKDLWEPALSWKDVDWIRSQTSLPVLIKGVINPEDAIRAIDHGAEAIVVSNHGGRQLDGTCPTAEVLAEIIEKVNGDCEVLVDGGIRRGTHVLKALALGAKAVLIGRPIFWSLALGGAEGVQKVLLHLKSELSEAMELAGCPGIADIKPDLIRKNEFHNHYEIRS